MNNCCDRCGKEENKHTELKRGWNNGLYCSYSCEKIHLLRLLRKVCYIEFSRFVVDYDKNLKEAKTNLRDAKILCKDIPDVMKRILKGQYQLARINDIEEANKIKFYVPMGVMFKENCIYDIYQQ